MNIALLGSGRTGSFLHDVVAPNDTVVDFNTSNRPTAENLADFDVIVSFLTGDVFSSYIDMLLDSNVPVVCGSTGFTWPSDFSEKLKDRGLTSVWSNNFSLGMQVAKNAIEALNLAEVVLPDADVSIHETHHIHKKDAPSGTAISWQEWYGRQIPITSERTGDVVGDHVLTIDAPTETITLSHSSKDRSIFAAGAYWVAQRIDQLSPGLYQFSQMIDILRKSNLGGQDERAQ